ncbi:(d)CMP kinase [Verrucomicrobium sp. GAS474]|uniref:(d)CMP kinase n=1 Tax=Verrucomicrobium sp. GAS474 TaxID=1882831 RepID=UPI0031B6039C
MEFLTQKYAQSLPERTWHALKKKINPPKPPARPEEGTILNHVIAIDGPAASGKSTVSRELAKRLGFAHVGTGTLYRALTWKLLDEKVDFSKPALVAERLKTMKIECGIEADTLVMRLDHIDPLPHVRDGEINEYVSAVAAIPAVRQSLLEKQRELLNHGPLVVEGRDIGTVVFPHTPFKFFIDADPEVRAARRAKDGEKDSVASRDAQDAARKAAPMMKAKDAIRIDTSTLSIDEVVETVLGFLEGKGLFENADAHAVKEAK